MRSLYPEAFGIGAVFYCDQQNTARIIADRDELADQIMQMLAQKGCDEIIEEDIEGGKEA